jgi:hypothetical protein
MATTRPNPSLARSGRASRAEYPPASLRFDWIATGLSFLLITGLNIDIWAHNHDLVDTSFFTPWHALMYGAFALFAGFLTLSAIGNIQRGHRLQRLLPRGHNLSLIGVAVFGFGGVADLGWHTVFGIEQGTEALLSPSHLILALGFTLLMSGSIRSAWLRRETEGVARWIQIFPAVLGMSFMLTLLMAFTQFSNAIYNGAFSTPDFTRYPSWLTLPLGVASILLQTAIMIGGLLLLLRRWKLPAGSLMVLLIMPALYIASYSDTYGLLPGVVITAIIGEGLLRVLAPTPERPLWLGIFCFTLPTVYFLAFFAGVQLIDRVAWRIHAWLGAAIMAGIVGVFLSLLVAKWESNEEASERT